MQDSRIVNTLQWYLIKVYQPSIIIGSETNERCKDANVSFYLISYATLEIGCVKWCLMHL